MTEAVLDDLGGYTVSDHQRGVTVTKIVKTDAGKTFSYYEAIPKLTNGIRHVRIAVFLMQDVAEVVEPQKLGIVIVQIFCLL